MADKILSVTYTDGTVRYSEAVYHDGKELYSMTAYLGDGYLEERFMYPSGREDLVTRRPCRTVETDGIIYGKVNPEYQKYILVDDFIVDNGHLRYVKRHSDEILEALGYKKGKRVCR